MFDDEKTVTSFPEEGEPDVTTGDIGPCLVVLVGKNVGNIIPLRDDEVVLGRGQEADVVLLDQRVSRKHAKIKRSGDEYLIIDLESTNGTYVNGERIHSGPLKDGDIIRLGGHVLKFLSSGNIETIYHRTIYHLATTDPLTQVHNRTYFFEHFKVELSRARRHNLPLSIMLTDIDDFKRINESFGHIVGDLLLQKVAMLMKHNLRKEDIIARYGGDEFVILLPVTGKKGALAVADKLRKLVRNKPFIIKGKVVKTSISCGISAMEGEPKTMDQLLQEADENLLNAKLAGKDKVVV